MSCPGPAPLPWQPHRRAASCTRSCLFILCAWTGRLHLSGSTDEAGRSRSRFNATVTVKTDYERLVSGGGGLLDHTRLLQTMVTLRPALLAAAVRRLPVCAPVVNRCRELCRPTFPLVTWTPGPCIPTEQPRRCSSTAPLIFRCTGSHQSCISSSNT